MRNDLNVDFNAIQQKITEAIQRGNASVNGDVSKIDSTARISAAVTIVALKEYHKELMKALNDTTV